MRPGQLERRDVEVYPTFARLASGHRLRLTVTTDDTALQPSATQIRQLAGGVYRIEGGGRHASFIDLPTAPSSRLRTSGIVWSGCNGGC